MDEVLFPEPREDEVLIKVKKAAICGTDLHIYKWDHWASNRVPVPLTIGHEFVGEIVELGKKVRGWSVGDRVCGEGHLTCGQCRFCRNGKRVLCPNTKGIGYDVTGCFAEYVVMPAENLYAPAEGISDDLAAIYDPYGNAIYTAMSTNLTGEDVLITGAGPIGIMACAIAKKAGARHIFITDVNSYRLDLAKKMGATCCVNTSHESLTHAMVNHNLEGGFTVGMEMSGVSEAFTQLLKAVCPGAHISLLGILPENTLIDWNLVIFKSLKLHGIYGREIFRTWYRGEALIQAGLDLTPVITHHFSLEDFEKGFEAMLSGECGKVILDL